jgi:hypothetical protein
MLAETWRPRIAANFRPGPGPIFKAPLGNQMQSDMRPTIELTVVFTLIGPRAANLCSVGLMRVQVLRMCGFGRRMLGWKAAH